MNQPEKTLQEGAGARDLQHAAENAVWVFGDRRTEALYGLSLRALNAARGAASSLGGRTVMVLTALERLDESTPPAVEAVPVEEAAEAAAAGGADDVHLYRIPWSGGAPAGALAQALADRIAVLGPRLVVFPLTELGRETAARVSALTGSGLIADCIRLEVEGGRVKARCPAWGGTVTAKIVFADDAVTGLVTVDPYAWMPGGERGAPGLLESFAWEGIQEQGGCTLLEVAAEAERGQSLEEAEVVVVGGAGLGNMEGFGLVRDLAAALGGEVGATRPPVFSRWVEEERLIGQTGKRVHPRLLFSIGTSGAVQYTAGIGEAGTIVAVNRDAEAPIFQVADIGVVADARIFLPHLTEAVQQLTLRRMADALTEAAGGGQGDGFGARFARLRAQYGWSLEALAEATDESPEFIRQVEEGLLTPPVGFLLRFANALKIDPGLFLRQEQKTLLRDLRAQAFVKRTRNYSYQTLSPGAENDHLRAFLITIESRQTHKPVAYKHEGEEFIFVMEGELMLTLGNRAHHLKPGDSRHFNSDIPHKLKSVSNEPTRCLVVLYTP
ncbi:FAD-binding protein [Desulfatiglans anilini]|uniref:FAD-binding protein n=1 Tax=Desulfatiglans anilini TaxID=90728 RepID=UPI0003F7C7D4|nr:FAD-binding protein [Desulfatiglans anilini]